MKAIGTIRGFAAVAITLASGLAAAQADDDFTYVAKQGDNLISIGKRLLARPADWNRLLKPNRIADPDLIHPGREIRIPLALLRSEAAGATVIESVGEVRTGADKAAAVGDALAEGAALRTGRDGFVTLRLVDGSTLTVQRQSELALERLRNAPALGLTFSRLRLDSGRVEAAARSHSPGSSRFEVRSRLATAAVRGTDFRVGVLGERNAVAAEVLSGSVGFAGAAQGASVLLGAGYGSVVEEGRAPRAPVALLAAPDLSAFPKLQERPLVRLRFPGVAQASSYRAQVARDAGFHAVLREELSGTPEARFVGLEDGDYHLRARAVDGAGIEGRDASTAFRLKARPEPPYPSAPAPQGKVRGTEARLEWTINPDAASYRVEIADDPDFKHIVRSEQRVREPNYLLSGVPFGEYHWRLASTRGETDRGPWGDAQRFRLLPPPANPEPPSEEAGALVFRWPSEPEQRFAVEIGRDEKFETPALRFEAPEPLLRIPRPAPGTYYLRMRATDADGFVGPYTRAQRFEVKALGGVFDSSGRPVTDAQGRQVGTQ